MSTRKYLSTPDKQKIVQAKKYGYSSPSIAMLFKCNKRTVNRLAAKSEEGQSLHRASKIGRPPITTKTEDRALIIDHKIDPNLTSSHGIMKLKAMSNKNIA